jgi:DNA-binding MarR family transcriptional regulator
MKLPMTAKERLPLALRAAYLALHRRTDTKFAKQGVTADQFVLMATLARGGQALTQRELAQRMPSDPSTVRAMLVLLEKQGLVERAQHPTDARARSARLTRQGKQKFQRLWKAGESIRSRMFSALEPEEADSLVRLLARITQSLHSENAMAGAFTSPLSSKEDV